MTNVEALKALYVALGNEAADVENANTIVGVLNAIAAKYEGKDDATTNSEGIENIIAVLDNIIPEPVPSENNAKFETTPTGFELRKNLASIDIPEGVTVIKSNAFDSCLNLKNVTIPSSVTELENNAFYNCPALKNVTISSGVTYMYFQTFNSCTALETITIDKPEGSITGAPWGAPETTQIIWNG